MLAYESIRLVATTVANLGLTTATLPYLFDFDVSQIYQPPQPDMSMDVFTGSCACERVSYNCISPPKEHGSTICHCKICRKLSGGPYQVFIGMHSKTVIWFDNTEHLRYEGLPIDSIGGIKLVRLSAIADRACCATCGSWMAMRYKSTLDKTYLTTGSIDTSSISSQAVRDQLTTNEEAYCSHRAEWLAQPRTEKQYPGMPPEFKESLRDDKPSI